ncbi:MAG TPA: PhoU domain-containing protein [Candidatus Bathyarchaeia archaeon]|nr:PhoU domain-containing protein [Candidatus Bathyarchaeia archaeon]
MEIRKVQLTGKSSFTVSLPKTWATQLGLKEQSRVALSMLPDGSLRVAPNEHVKPQERGVFKIDTLFDDALARHMIAIYIAGYDTFELRAQKIRSDQRETIRDMSYRLIGMEVVEETAKSVVIQDFLSPNELQVRKSIRRMHLIIESMLADATKSLLKNDPDLANDVVVRDRDVDRHYLLTLKRLQAMVKTPFAEASDIGANESLEYYLTAVSLERIADHATKIARCVLTLDGGSVPEDVRNGVNEASDLSNKIIQLAMDALSKLDTKLAEEAINAKSRQLPILKRLEETTLDLDAHVALPIYCIVNSIDRVADYGMNIAEVAINLAVAKTNQ